MRKDCCNDASTTTFALVQFGNASVTECRCELSARVLEIDKRRFILTDDQAIAMDPAGLPLGDMQPMKRTRELLLDGGLHMENCAYKLDGPCAGWTRGCREFTG